jgi:hypothetical protein
MIACARWNTVVLSSTLVNTKGPSCHYQQASRVTQEGYVEEEGENID